MLNSDAVTALAIFPSAAAIAWAGVYAWGQWLRHQHDVPLAPGGSASTAEAARLARVEAELEALTLEMERLAEGQRYTTRLLEERLPHALLAADRLDAPRSERAVTPH